MTIYDTCFTNQRVLVLVLLSLVPLYRVQRSTSEAELCSQVMSSGYPTNVFNVSMYTVMIQIEDRVHTEISRKHTFGQVSPR